MKKILVLLLFSICLFAQNQPRDQNLVAGEYFINNDPGEGNGISLSSTYGFATANVNIFPLLNINDVIYIRFKSSNGKWGPPRSFKYKYPVTASGSVIQAGEYFVNTDPGLGNATKFNIDPSDSIKLNSINRNDKIYLRVKDSFGRWSDAVCVTYRYKTLISAQYKIKFKSGSLTAWQNMTIQSQQIPSAFYTALSDPLTSIDKSTIDTVYVRFQSEDYISGRPSLITDVKEIRNNIPIEYSMSNAYPNPFNPSTKIRFDIPRISHIKLIVYDILGREVETLVDKEMMPGSYELTFDGNVLPSGIYFCRMQGGGFVETKKLLLLK